MKNASDIIDEVTEAAASWGATAKECDVDPDLLKKIAATHRMHLAGK